MEEFDQEIPSPLPGELTDLARPAEPEPTTRPERTCQGERSSLVQIAPDELADGRCLCPRDPTSDSDALADPKHLKVGPQPETDPQPEPPGHR
jgi:hypothetical protein